MIIVPVSPLILALDVPTAAEALAWADKLNGVIQWYKVGLRLFTAEGPQIVRDLQKRGANVFLDLKLHDIPNTVADAVEEAANLGVKMLTVHTLGGPEMIAAAVKRLEKIPAAQRPLLLGVTVLTSHTEQTLADVGVGGPVEERVVVLAQMSHAAGLRGFVLSPKEILAVRNALGAGVTLVTPGVRMPGESADDQARVLTPAQAIANGANYLVIGRPILKAADPIAAARAIVVSIAEGVTRG